MYSKVGLGCALLGMSVVLCPAAEPTDFSGHWQVDAAKSKFGPEHTISLDLEQQGQNITFTRVYDHHGKQAKATFTCALGSSACPFDDDGHKAKVSLWYSSPELVILKTDGDKKESTVEWHLLMADGGKTLKVNREVLEPEDSTESMVLVKDQSLANR